MPSYPWHSGRAELPLKLFGAAEEDIFQGYAQDPAKEKGGRVLLRVLALNNSFAVSVIQDSPCSTSSTAHRISAMRRC